MIPFDVDDPRTKARRTDPITSHIAAHEIVRHGTAAAHRERIMAVLAEAHHPMTTGEIAVRGEMGKDQVFRRMAELWRAGLVFYHPERRCEVSGTLMRTYASKQLIEEVK